MKCLVCSSPAKEVISGGDYVEIHCPDCGAFRISGSLLAIQRQRVFDVDATRSALERMPRLHGIPMLGTVDEGLLRNP